MITITRCIETSCLDFGLADDTWFRYQCEIRKSAPPGFYFFVPLALAKTLRAMASTTFASFLAIS
jgi:hypothetical protein